MTLSNVNWKLIFDKVGTVIVDRRFWINLFTLAAILFGFPQLTDNAEGLSDQAVSIANLIVQAVALIAIPFNLTMSWTKRSPSGLDYKNALLQTLRDIGVDE